LKDKRLFKFWLLGIVKNVVNNYLKKSQRKYISLESYAKHLYEEEENKDMQRIAQIVVGTIQSLQEPYRNIITLFYYEGMSIKEIADACALSIETVKVRLHRARKLLKEAFQQYPELQHYHHILKHKHFMKKVRIADIMMSGANKEHCSILLQDEENTSVFLIIISTAEAMSMVMALKHIEPPRPFVFNLMANMMKENKLQVDSVHVHDIIDGIFISTLKLRNGKKSQELDARPSDAITFALMFDKPIFVSQKILDLVGFPVPEKYKHAASKEKGIETLIAVIEAWKKSMMPDKTKFKPKNAQEVQQAMDKLLASAFGDE
jgi:bifunctional DNase/RNase